MRIRLIVQRNGFPPTQILWTSKGFRPDRGAANESITIAQLLEQINEIIPIECEDWGLEDYAVELQGFECLHFSVLSQILKEDDELTIRPLGLSDRRVRRASGRHQISTDGRHLYDGVAFGRPLLKRPVRPSIRIPSLKRPRLEYDQDGQDDTVESNTQLLLEQPGDEDDPLRYLFEDDEEEYNGIADASAGGELNASMGSDQGRLRGSRKRQRTGLGILNGDAPLQDGSNGPVDEVALTSGLLERENTSAAHGRDNRNSRRSSRSSTKSVRFEGDNLETPATVLAIHESDSDDDDFDPAAEVDASDSSDKENLEPKVNGVDETTSDDETSSSGASSSESGGSASSDRSTSSGKSSGAASEAEDSESESESESSSESSSEDSVIESKVNHVAKVVPESKAKKVGNVASLLQELAKATDASKEPSVPKFTPPNQGTAATKSRNMRRQHKNALERLKREGILPQCATITDFKRHVGLIPPAHSGVAITDEVSAVEAKKKELLQSLASNNPKQAIDSHRSAPSDLLSTSEPLKTGLADITMGETAEHPGGQPNTTVVEKALSEQAPGTADSQAEKSPASAPSQRRMKLDVEASRRFILKSLNLPGQRAKPGEKAQPAPAEAPGQDVAPEEPAQQEEEPVRAHIDDDDWKPKIDLRAVECCQEGVELSTPPFPFYQRWDPQQQLGGRGGRGKKRKRNRQQYYDQSGYGDDHGNDYGDDYGEPHYYEDEPLQDPDSSNVTQAALDSQLHHDASASAVNRLAPKDLPALPADLDERPEAAVSDVRQGDIIAFKNMYMSQATNWSPVVSEYKTAKVVSPIDDGLLDLLLARRDVEVPEKHFDARTGQRVYNKFEMPGYDQSEEGEDNRSLRVDFSDLIVVKLVARAEGDVPAPSKDQHSMDAAVSDTGRKVQEVAEPEQMKVVLVERDLDRAVQHANPMQESRARASKPSPDPCRDLNQGQQAETSELEVAVSPRQSGLVQEFATENKAPSGPGIDLNGDRQAERLHDAPVAEIAEEDRRDISLLMKQAGFCSEVHSDVAHVLSDLGERSKEQAQAQGDQAKDHATSSSDKELDPSGQDHAELPLQSPDANSLYDADAFEDPPTFFETDSIAGGASSDRAIEESASPAELSMEESTFVPATNDSDSATPHDPDFPTPKSSRRPRSSQSRGAAAASEPAEEPLSKRTRSSGVSALEEPMPRPRRSTARRQISVKMEPPRSSPSLKQSSDYDLPSPGALLGPRTQPNPPPARLHAADASPEPELPLSSPIRDSSSRRRHSTKRPSPAISDSPSGSPASDMFAPSDDDDELPLAPARDSTRSKGRAGKAGRTAASKKSATQAGPARRAQIVDLTLSSDPREASDDASPDRDVGRVERERKSTGLPPGPGWVRKSTGGGVKKKKTPVKRTRSSV